MKKEIFIEEELEIISDKFWRDQKETDFAYNELPHDDKTTKFILEAEEKYGEFSYGYDQVEYVDSETTVRIYCPVCKEYFEVKPSLFLSKNFKGCPKCLVKTKTGVSVGPGYRMTKEDFIQRAERKYGKGTYEYDQVVYTGSNNKVKIYCPVCKEYFEMRASSFLDPRCPGCPKCSHRKLGLKLRTPQEEWIKKATEKWGDTCDYTETIYTGANNPVTVFCKEHQGYFTQRASTHMTAAYGCPVCSFKHTASESLGEKMIEEILGDLGVPYEREYQLRGVIQGRNTEILRIDFRYLLGDQEYWIEYHGEQHYTDIKFFSHGDPDWFSKQQLRDQSVREYCKKCGINLLEIPYTYLEKGKLMVIISEFNQGRLPEIIKPEQGKSR